MEKNIDMTEFKEKLLNALLGVTDITQNIYTLTKNDLNQIRNLQKTKYQTWEWNYGESPASSNIKEKRFLGGKLEIYFDLNEGKLKNFKLYGDFLDVGDITLIEELLKNCNYEESHVIRVLNEIQVNEYIMNISNEDLKNCLFM